MSTTDQQLTQEEALQIAMLVKAFFEAGFEAGYNSGIDVFTHLEQNENADDFLEDQMLEAEKHLFFMGMCLANVEGEKNGN